MTENQGSFRILVIDDSTELRAVIRRVLAANGYHIDDVATAAEARALDPYTYQGVLIDVRLGPELGSDFIREMVAAVPDMAGRCLAITGGGIDAIPEGIAYLTKPFKPAQLVAAVETLTHAGEDGRQPPVRSGLPAARRPAQQAATGAWQGKSLLALIRLVRMRERQDLADRLHDGPVQELSAAALGLHMMMRTGQGAGQTDLLESIIGQVDRAAVAMRGLMRECGQGRLSHDADTGLAAAVRDRIDWLLASPAEVDIDPPQPELPAEQVSLVADVAELMLCLLPGDGPLPSAQLSVQVTQDATRIDVAATMPGGSGIATRPPADPDVVHAYLRELAAALAATVQVTGDSDQIRARLTIPRS